MEIDYSSWTNENIDYTLLNDVTSIEEKKDTLGKYIIWKANSLNTTTYPIINLLVAYYHLSDKDNNIKEKLTVNYFNKFKNHLNNLSLHYMLSIMIVLINLKFIFIIFL